MLKVIVCDDIPVIRENIVNLLKETYPEIEVTGVYFDGRAVIDHLKRETVDLIVSDIRMKTITGIDVLKYISEHHLKTRVIIITAYPEFSYAKDAINFHAAKFITKPISTREFLAGVDDVLQQIKSDSSEEQDHLTNVIVKRNEFSRKLIGLCDGTVRFADLEAYCKKNENPNLSRVLYITDIKIKSRNSADAEFSWYDIAECLNPEIDTYIIDHSVNECKVFAFINRTVQAEEKYRNYIKQVTRSFKNFHQIEISVISNRFDSIDYLYGRSSRMPARIVELLNNGDFIEASEVANSIKCGCSLKDKKNVISYLCYRFNDYYFSCNLEEINDSDFADKVLDEIIDQIANESQNNYKKLLFDKLQHYISKNFSDPMLSLESVATAFHFSPSYLSKLFSDYKGVSFTAFLTEMRMEHAKNLLKNTNITIQEVASQCGYNVKYFSRLFTKKNGVNPRQYRNRSVGL